MNEEEFLMCFCENLSEKIDNQSFVNNLEDLIVKRKLTNTTYKKLIEKEFLE